MPLRKGSSPAVVSQNIRELHTGKTYAHTAAKFGTEKANKQSIAIALSTARRYGKKYAEGGDVDPLTGVNMEPSEAAQGKFSKYFTPIYEGIKQQLATPGKYLNAQPEPETGPMTEEEAFRLNTARDNQANWGASTALGMVGIGRLPGAAPEGAVGVAGAKLKQPEVQPTVPKSEPFYSAVEQAVKNAKDEKAPPQRWLNAIKNSNEVKAEEMEWLGLPEWLGQQKSPLTRDQVADYIRAHKIDLEESHLGNTPEFNQAKEARDVASDAYAKAHNEWANAVNRRKGMAEVARLEAAKSEALMQYQAASGKMREIGDVIRDPQYSQYSLPGRAAGDKSNREFLLRLPDREGGAGKPAPYPWVDDEGFLAEAPTHYNSNYYNTHYRDPNILAHIRTTDRNVDGYKTLFLEELQSDWHQAGGRHGYLKPAAEQNKLRQEASSLRTQLDTIKGEHRELRNSLDATGPEYQSRVDELRTRYGSILERLDDINRELINHGKVPDAPLKGTAWQKMAMKRMIHYAAEHGYDAVGWSPAQVQIDRWGKNTASGMVHSYDKVMPDIMNGLGKKFGAKVERRTLDTHARDPYPEGVSIHHMVLPDQMKEHVLRHGYPFFRRGGEVSKMASGGNNFNPMKWIPRPNNLERTSFRPPAAAHTSMPRPAAMPHVGMIHSTVPGRSDKLPMNVRGGSYVIPASVVSGMAQGNSIAGANALNKLFGQGPYGDKMQKFGTPKVNFGHPMHMASPMRMPRPSAAGGVEGDEDTVPIIAAGGEYIVSPEAVKRLGGGDMKKGHRILDELVLHIRRQTIKDMKAEKPPKK